MKKVEGMLDSKIFEKIISSWEAAAKTRNHDKMAENIPETSTLKVLLEMVYITSIKLEEGKPIKTRIAFFHNYTPEDLIKPPNQSKGFQFKEPVELSVKNLRKLSLAFEQENAALAVSFYNDRYTIIGSLFYGRVKSRLDSGTTWRPRPQTLIMSSRSPGSVIISFGDDIVGRFEDGEFIIANAGPFGSSVFVSHILKTTSKHRSEENSNYWYFYRDCIERLYTNVPKFGHGGTIVWVPKNDVVNVKAELREGIEIISEFSGTSLLNAFLDKDSIFPGDNHTENYRRELADYIDFLSTLACIDGALAVDDNLALIKFGTHLASKPWQGRILEGQIGSEIPQKPFDISRFGTKHRSAVNFAGSHPGTILFVISEDGPIRAISQFNNTVLIWPDCLNTVFLD